MKDVRIVCSLFVVFACACGSESRDREIHGRSFTWLKDLLTGEESPLAQQFLRKRAPNEVETRETRDTRDTPPPARTREELAEALRPMAMYDGQVYVASEVAWDLADAALELGDRELKIEPSATLPDGVDLGVAPALELPEGVIASISDARYTVSNQNLQIPFSWHIYYEMRDIYDANQRGSCSAVMIGRNTALTAAHCWYSLWNFASGFGTLDLGAAAADTQDFFWYPFGTFAAPLGAWWPSCWNGSATSCDYVVIDTGDNPNNPGWDVGYMGWWVNAPEWSTNNNDWAFGYPGSCPGLSQKPQPCGMIGTLNFYHSPNYPQILYWDNVNVYTSEGQSGTAHFVRDAWNGNFYAVGVHNSITNIRRIDSDVWSFVQAVSRDY